jgi:RNA polymerase sigma factor (TIGR02999 family)
MRQTFLMYAVFDQTSLMKSESSLTELLQRFSAGDREIAEAVLREVLPRLHQIAMREVRRERYVAPVTPTELINEVWLRNLHKGGWTIHDREHFYAIAANAMRHVLVDLARQRLAQSRGSGEFPASLNEISVGSHPATASPEKIVEMGLLLDKLEKKHPSAARVVEMRHFAGYTHEEIAEFTGLTVRQVRHLWEMGRNWLQDRLESANSKKRRRASKPEVKD